MSRLLLIDGNNIMNRAFFAIPPLNDETGRNVNAVYGFLNIFFKAVNDYAPTHVVAAFDSPWPTKRHLVYPEYKAFRRTMDDSLRVQMPIIRELLSLLGVFNVALEGIEADDIIGSYAKRCGINTVILSGDRDLWQLADDKIMIVYPKKGVSEAEEITPEIMAAEYDLSPSQIVDYKALCGDSSDNIPGVKGIGDKTAKALLKKYGSLDGVYGNIDDISGKTRERLAEDRETALLSKELAKIDTEACGECGLDSCGYGDEVSADAVAYLKALKFNTILKKLEAKREKATENGSAVLSKSVFTGKASTDSAHGKPSTEGAAPLTETAPQTETDLKDAVAELKKAERLAIYFGKDLLIALSEGRQYRFKTYGDNFLDESYGKIGVEDLREVFECAAEKILYDGKETRHYLNTFGVTLRNAAYDLSIMNYLSRGKSAEGAKDMLSEFRLTEDAASFFAIERVLSGELTAAGLNALYRDVELPLSELLFEMECCGVSVDISALEELRVKLLAEREDVEKETFALIGEKINLNSTKQLAEVLYNKLNLPKGKKTKSGYSTDNDELTRLEDSHPVIPLILRHRLLTKLIGTYVEGMKQHIERDGIVRTTYNQTLTATGRLSSSDPNLQNIPAGETGKDIRRLFVSRNGALISADYSQIELRLLAEFSGDAALIESFNAGKDIHRIVAGEIFNLPPEMINDSMRRTAKAVNFGIIYGISDYGLSQNTGITQGRAKTYIKKYFERYPSIRAYLDKSVEDARRDRFITTLSGRRRYLPEISAPSARVRAFGERAAMNMPLQGSAADIMKIAMIEVFRAFRERGLKSTIILQVHDELVIDAFRDEMEEVAAVLREKMENAVKTQVKLTVNVASGANLAELK